MKIYRFKHFTDEDKRELRFSGSHQQVDITLITPKHESQDADGTYFTVQGSVNTFRMKRPKVKNLVEHLTEWLEETK